MPEQIAVLVGAVVAHFGQRSHRFALEQVNAAEMAGEPSAVLSWTRIADGIIAAPVDSSASDILPDTGDSATAASELPVLQQLLYVSTAKQHCDEDALGAILRSSRDNNVLYGVTGILWSDGNRFIQVFEGSSDSVGETYDRILADGRHHALTVVHDRQIEKRDFGSWSMLHRRSYDTDDEYDRKLRRALVDIPDPIRATLRDFVGIDDACRVVAGRLPGPE